MTKENNTRTEQEIFWAGDFGSDYINRNKGDEAVASNIALFSRALRSEERRVGKECRSRWSPYH